MIGNIERIIAAVTKVVGEGDFVSVGRDGESISVSVSGNRVSEPRITYDVLPNGTNILSAESGVPLSAEAQAVKTAVDAILAPVDEAYLDALPDDTIVRVVEVRDLRSRIDEQGSLFQKFGSVWVELDPSDRYDGENGQPSGYLLARARQFKSPEKADNLGRVEVVIVEEER